MRHKRRQPTRAGEAGAAPARRRYTRRRCKTPWETMEVRLESDDIQQIGLVAKAVALFCVFVSGALAIQAERQGRRTEAWISLAWIVWCVEHINGRVLAGAAVVARRAAMSAWKRAGLEALEAARREAA
jgi:hypothetical protein